MLDPAWVRRESLLAATVAAITAAAALVLAPPGVDLAAHVYQRALFIAHGFTLWNNFWYAGRYSFVGYSFLYYPVAAMVGTTILAVASMSFGAAAFALLVCEEWGQSAKASSRAFAAVWPAIILAAAFPFALGAALAMIALVALQRRRTQAFAIFTVLTLATSPLAFLILAVVSLGIAAGRRPTRAQAAAPFAVVASASVAQLVVMRLFPSSGFFPFTFVDLSQVLLFSVIGMALTHGLPRARALYGFFAVYGAVSIVAFAIPSSLGSNIGRVRYAAIPLALLVLALRNRKRVWLNVVVVALAVLWNLTPAVGALTRSSADDSQRYWAPAIAFLHSHLSRSYRVEVVDTSDHWAAAYLPAAQIPIARGWFRQDDFPQNELLYDRRITRGAYLAWLHDLGVRYVLMTDLPTDYSARAEARLLRSGRSGLRELRQVGHVTVFSVPHPRPIVTGPATATILHLGDSDLVVSLGAAGSYHVAVRWSPYWNAPGGCIEEAPDRQMTLQVRRRGVVHLRFAVSLQQGLDTFVGLHQRRRCTRSTDVTSP